MRPRRRLRGVDLPAAPAGQQRQQVLGDERRDLHVPDLRPPAARPVRPVQGGAAPRALRRRRHFLPLVRVRVPRQPRPGMPRLPAALAVRAPLPFRGLRGPSAQPCAAHAPRSGPSTAASPRSCCPTPAAAPVPRPSAPAAGTAPAEPPAQPAASRSRRPWPRSPPAAGPPAHADPRCRQAHQAHRTQTPSMLNLSQRFKHPAPRVASRAQPGRSPRTPVLCQADAMGTMQRIAPIFAVHDLDAAMRYYQRLGFTVRAGGMLETCGPAGKGCTFPVTQNRFSSKVGVPAPVGKVHPMPTVTPDLPGCRPAGRPSSLIDRSSARAPGGCSRRRCGPRWMPTSPVRRPSGTSTVTGWWSGTGRPSRGRC